MAKTSNGVILRTLPSYAAHARAAGGEVCHALRYLRG